MDKLTNYKDWRYAIVDMGGFTLDQAYCEERIATLENDNDKGTQAFLNAYGAEYRDKVILWFKQALEEG